MVRAIRPGVCRRGEGVEARPRPAPARCRLRSLRAEEFEHRQCRHVLLAACGAGQRRRAEQAKRLVVHDQRGVPVPVQLAGGRKSSTSSSRRSAKLSHNMFRSWPSEPLATRQPSFNGPTRFSAGTRTSLKNTSLKSRSSASHTDANGRRTTPGRSVGIISTLMPLCLGGIRIGANKSQDDVGVVGARRPHLLAVDHEVVAAARDDLPGCAATPGRIPRPVRSSPTTRSSRPAGSGPPSAVAARACRTRSATPR